MICFGLTIPLYAKEIAIECHANKEYKRESQRRDGSYEEQWIPEDGIKAKLKVETTTGRIWTIQGTGSWPKFEDSECKVYEYKYVCEVDDPERLVYKKFSLDRSNLNFSYYSVIDYSAGDEVRTYSGVCKKLSEPKI